MDHLLNLGAGLQQQASGVTSASSGSPATRPAKSPDADYLPIGAAFSAGETRRRCIVGKHSLCAREPSAGLQSKSTVR